MEIQLRPSRVRLHPLVRPASRLRGMGATYTPLDCTGYPGDAQTACVNENLRRQQVFFAQDYDERLAAFIAACDRDWKLNDDQYKALGLPRPVNNCADRTYGLTLPGTSGGQVQAQIPVTYMPAEPPPAVYVPAPAPAPAPVPAAAAPAPAPAPAASDPGWWTGPAPKPVDDDASFLETAATVGNQTIAGTGIPLWAIAAVAAGLYFMTRGK